MPITNTYEVADQRGSGYDVKTDRTSLERTWVVVCTGTDIGPKQAMDSITDTDFEGVPLSKKSCKPHNGDQFGFDVTLTFEFPDTNSGGSGSGSTSGPQPTNPLARDWVVNFQDQITQENWHFDTEDQPYRNSAKAPFSDQRQRQRTIGTITLEKNFASYNDAAYQLLRDSCNDADVTIRGTTYPKGTLLMREINGAQQYEVDAATGVGVNFYKVTFNVGKDPRKFQPFSVESRGTMQSTNRGADKKWAPILDGTGQPTTLPWPLNSSGVALSSIDAAPAMVPEDPVTATSGFKPYFYKDWSAIGFPAT